MINIEEEGQHNKRTFSSRGSLTAASEERMKKSKEEEEEEE